jgi:hypothetical protein
LIGADGIAKATNFWREVLRRIITIILTLATLCLPYRGHREIVGCGQCEGGNFLGMIKMQIELGDPFLKELIEKPSGATKYLSPSIQNEIVRMLSDATRNSLVNAIKDVPWYSVIVDTTSDICRIDQISIVVRWVDLHNVMIKETFLGFLEAKDGGTAEALSKTVIAYLVQLGVDPLKIRGQGYDGASVMSGDKGGVNVYISRHLEQNGVLSPAPFVHCASHNLNLVVNDAVESNVLSVSFFGVLAETFSFFNRSINRSADFRKLGCADVEDKDNPLSLKKLCTTRWSSRIESVRAIKNRLSDILNLLKQYSKGRESKEKSEASDLLKKINTLEFLLSLIIWEKILTAINLASKDLQAFDMDLGKSSSELGRALNSIKEMRGQWRKILKEATILALKFGFPVTFVEKRTRRVPRFFDEEATDEPIINAETKFRVELFFPIIDTITLKLEERFKGQHFVAKTFNFLSPKNLLKMTSEEIHKAAKDFVEIYQFDMCSKSDQTQDYYTDLSEEILSYRLCFQEDLVEMEDGKRIRSAADVLKHLCENEMTSSYSKLVSAIVLFLTLPVTVATAERSFSKLKIIKNYLRSTMAQERLNALAIISIEVEEAKKLDIDKMIDIFADKKARSNKFNI